jgi:hypothetical protein
MSDSNNRIDKPLSLKELKENAALKKKLALEHAEEQKKEMIVQQIDAQIAALSCAIPHESIQTGIKKVVMALRKKPKTLYDYNKERVRDTKYGKPEPPSKVDWNALEKLGGTYNFYAALSDPSPYIRDYEYKSFDSFKLHVNKKFATFQNIAQIDLSGQLLGDERFKELCDILPRCSVVNLSVSTNQITDVGLGYLASCLRSLTRLETLILADNNFSDAGVMAIFDDHTYSPSLKMIDLSKNMLTHKTAYILGEQFNENGKQNKLEDLFLGGRVGPTSWGDTFVRVLLHTLSKPGYRPVQRLSIPDAGLTPDGVETICTLLVCNDEIRWLNLSKTGIYAGSKKLLALALSVNSSLESVFLGRCGLSKKEKIFFEELRKKQYPLTWQEKIFVSIGLAKELTECHRTYHELITTQMSTDWTILPPMPFPHIDKEIEKTLIDPLLSPESMFWCPTDIKNRILSCDVYFQYLQFLKTTVADCYKLLPEDLASRENIVDAFERMDERKKIMQFTYSVCRTLCTRLSTSNEPVVKKKGKTNTTSSSSSNSNKKKVTLDVEAIAMNVEDMRSSVVEYATTIEAYVSEIYKTYLVHVKYKDSDSSDDGFEILKEEIPYYSTIGLPACFVHYVYTFDPAEKDRERRAALKQVRDDLIKGMEGLRDEARRARIRPILGSRFHLSRGSDYIHHDPSEPLVTRKSVYANLHELKAVLQKKMEYLSLSSTEIANRQKKDQVEDVDEDTILAQLKTYDDVQEEVSRKPTRFLVAKKELQRRYEELIIEELDDNNAEFNLSRKQWQLAIGCERKFSSGINKEIFKNDVPIVVEEEVSRSDMHDISIQTVNTMRYDEIVSQRLRFQREQHLVQRERELHE